MRRFLFLLIGIIGWSAGWLWSQNPDPTLMDPEVYFNQVLANHPIASQARLLDAMSEAEVMAARGRFDPKIVANWDNKDFEDKNYYQYLHTEIKVPTRSPINGIASYNTSDGIFINPERTTPQAGLVEVGLEAQLGQGLFIDQRRADLAKAQLLIQANTITRRMILNDLLADATVAYWNWAESAANVAIYEEAILLAENRFEAVKQTYLNGDEPAIDTLEAFIRLEQRRIDRAKEVIKLRKAANFAWAFLWSEDGEPVFPDSSSMPSELSAIEIGIQFENGFWDSELIADHPALSLYDVKTEQAMVDRKWAREQLKPELNVKWLQQSLPPGNEAFAPTLANHKFAVGFSLPVFLRKARASVQKADIKLETLNLQREGKRRELLAKAEALRAELNLLVTQIQRQNQIVIDYTRLYQAENIKFRIGESSLFKLQSRENSLIKARLDQAKLLASYPRVEIELLRTLGQVYIDQE